MHQNIDHNADTPGPTKSTATIDVKRLSQGDVVWVETEQYLYKITVRLSVTRLVQVSSGDKSLGRMVVAAGVLCRLPVDIKQGEPLQFDFRFAHKTIRTRPVLHAEVRGKGWSYEVF